MSARSPRGSISAASNVAEDFEESLKDLQQNNRYEISNLTLIAKESTESAQAISKALETHIRTTAPSRKLPALYVLDSIVKNVGTPYTVYLGRNLYSTFMDAYLLVDSNTRRSMEGMLKTWKEHVPGSLDPRPVFPPETVRPIENALLKAKSLQNQRQPYQQTQTPPQHHGQFQPPNAQHQYPQIHQGQQATPFPPQPYQTPTPVQHFQVPGPHGLTPQANNVETIKNDLTALISRMQGQFASNPQDATLRTKLQALLQLQEVMRTQAHVLRDTELEQIRAQISQLSNPPQPAPTPQWQPPPVPQPYINTPPQFLSPQKQPPPPQSQPDLASLLAPGALNGLQALLSGGQKPSTPQMRSAVPALQNASHSQLNHVQKHVNAAPSMNSTDLLAALSKSNLLPPLPVPTPLQSAEVPASVPAPNASSTEALLASIKSFLPPSQNSTPMQPHPGKPHMPMTPSSLKTFRPELIRALYDAQPNQCTNCGRRFLATEEGRAQKSRHLDWHFRTNQRMADSSTNRGSHRNWFVDEMEWIRLVDFDPSTTTAEDASQMQAKKVKKDVSEMWVRAAPGQTKNTCSICYEEMRTTYSEENHDWVFGNAVMGGAPGKIVHATCAEEIRKSAGMGHAGSGGSGSSLANALAGLGSGGRTSRSATPDSSLGKRKAESVLAGVGAQRVKME